MFMPFALRMLLFSFRGNQRSQSVSSNFICSWQHSHLSCMPPLFPVPVAVSCVFSLGSVPDLGVLMAAG
jgi:hypothetical protein